MITLRDIAQSVGCDLSTVSRVLNGRPNRVSEANRTRIREAADQLGYVANRTASSLVTGATRTVGVLIPNVFDGVYAEYLETLDLELSAAGYTLRPFICHNRPDKEEAALRALLQHEVDAMIAMYHRADSRPLYDLIAKNRLPLIFRCRDFDSTGEFDAVQLDINEGYRALCRHLIEQGCRKIGLLGPWRNVEENQEFRNTPESIFAETLRAAGLPIPFRPSVFCEDSQEDACRALSARLREEPDAFDGIIVHNINKVFGCCRALREAGLAIPGDVKVATISDLALCRMAAEPLTVWAQPVPGICRALVELTLARLRTPEAPPQTVRFHSTLIARESTQKSLERK